jgi:hypothetical protein
MRHITLFDIAEAVDKAVALRGADYVYDKGSGGCTYRWTPNHTEDSDRWGAPACLLGQALDVLGLLDVMVPEDGYDDDERPWWRDNEDMSITGLIENNCDQVTFSAEATRFALVAQSRQDYGDMWGEARRVAREELALPLTITLPVPKVVAEPVTEPELVSV